jgi:bacteriocin biosynthesis cyclodehydratase domain-containing protein
MTHLTAVLSSAGPAGPLSVGEFGDQVIAFLLGGAGSTAAAGADRAAVGDADGLDAVFESTREPVVLALWRPCPSLCRRADNLAFRYWRPWLPVVMDHPRVRVGPLVAPGRGACFGCFEARRAQHDDHRADTDVVLAAYDRDAGLGPRGHLSQHARLAAALAEIMLSQFAHAPSAAAGQVISLNMLGGGLRRHRVVPVPGCARCGPPRRPGDSDVLAGLAGLIGAGRKPGAATAAVVARGETDAR